MSNNEQLEAWIREADFLVWDRCHAVAQYQQSADKQFRCFFLVAGITMISQAMSLALSIAIVALFLGVSGMGVCLYFGRSFRKLASQAGEEVEEAISLRELIKLRRKNERGF